MSRTHARVKVRCVILYMVSYACFGLSLGSATSRLRTKPVSSVLAYMYRQREAPASLSPVRFGGGGEGGWAGGSGGPLAGPPPARGLASDEAALLLVGHEDDLTCQLQPAV